MAQQDYNAKHEAVNYGTIWTNGLFEDNKSVLNFSRVGVINIRIPWSCIIWGGVFGAIAGIVLFLIYLLLGASGVMIPILFAVDVMFIGLGAKLGNWSPMKKTTGEDLMTYLKFMAREKISNGGFGAGKVSKTMMKTYAVGGEKGKMEQCEEYLGTQPLRNAPPMNPYVAEYSSPYELRPRGVFKVIHSDKYNDGLGDRGLTY